jgi:hypothetical protein
MPKKKSSRPNSNLGSSQFVEPKSPSQLKRDRIVRIAAITIVLALVLSFLAGALAFTPSQPASAADLGTLGKSVQIMQGDDSPVGTGIDTDGDGIENNLDPDIDNDGVVNANDSDIDGDGTGNFDDGDPAATNGFDGNPPSKPGSILLKELVENGSLFWLIGVGLAVLITLGLILTKTLKNRRKNAQKNY